MKLAFVLHQYFPYGGLQRDALAIALAATHRGHQVEFLTMKWEGEKWPGMPVHLFPKRQWIGYKRYLAFEKAINQYIKQQNYDGVVGFNKMGGLDIYYAADLCFAATLKDKPWANLLKWLPRYRYFLDAEKRMCDQKTQLLLINPQVGYDFEHYYHVEKNHLHFLPPGIDKSRAWRADAPERRLNMRRKLNIKPNEKMILCIGSAFKTKGVDRSIRALASLPAEWRARTQLWVVGKDDPASYQALAKELGVGSQVHFMLGSDQVPDLLQAADVLLHPALLENTGTVIVEAIVAGLPVLTTANCGYAGYVEKAQAGCVLPEPFNQEALNQRLTFMLNSDDGLWRKRGIQFGQQNDVYSMPDKAAHLIEQLLQA
jgi:UDP-glucose:(heptosyl)LPS alpha-1,3-glucosyltransferase